MTRVTLRSRVTAAVTLAVVAAGLMAGCTATTVSDPAPVDVVATLGAVPIPTAPPLDPVPTAVPGTPQVLAMGAPTVVILDAETDGTATATGPDQTNTLPTGDAANRNTDATITLTVSATHGSITLDPVDLICRDETGAEIALTPTGAASGGPVTVAAGTTGVVVVTGHFESGAAQVTWQPAGKPIAIWDFNIELD